MFDMRTATVMYVAAATSVLVWMLFNGQLGMAGVLGAAGGVVVLSKVPVRWLVPRSVRLWIRRLYWSVRNKVYRARARLELF